MDKFLNFSTDKKEDRKESLKKIYQSKDLFRGDREIIIAHGEDRYRLQITKAGKLILNK